MKFQNEQELDKIKNFLRPTAEPWRQTVRSTIEHNRSTLAEKLRTSVPNQKGVDQLYKQIDTLDNSIYKQDFHSINYAHLNFLPFVKTSDEIMGSHKESMDSKRIRAHNILGKYDQSIRQTTNMSS